MQSLNSAGKTFLYYYLCYYFRARGDIILYVAFSGIAALLLPGGQILYSRFKISLKYTLETVYKIS